MSEELTIEGKQYISSKRASEISGYAQDYIGQLARASHIDAHRIGGLWYVSLDSLHAYKEKAEAVVPNSSPQVTQRAESEALVSFDGKDYVSAAKAAQMTGYHQDYVGQLARAGKVLSRQIGNRWYVDRDGILTHKEEKDRLLGAVQAQSVGIIRREEQKMDNPAPIAEGAHFYRYSAEESPLLPTMREKIVAQEEAPVHESVVEDPESHPIAIKVSHRQAINDIFQNQSRKIPPKVSRTPRKSISYAAYAGAALGIILVVVAAARYTPISKTFSSSGTSSERSLAAAVVALGDILEPLLTKELTYVRKSSQD